MHKALNINRLHVSYQDTEALCNISPSVDKGKIVGLCSPNSAGSQLS